MTSEYMPICLRLRGQKCLVIGGGNVAIRKIRTLLKFGAKITCISPELTPQLKRLNLQKRIEHIKAAYSNKISFKAFLLIVAATDNKEINQKIVARGQKEKVLVNSATGKKCDVIFPAILMKKELVVAVSTGGKSCSTAQKTRDKLKDLL